jgi:hypothetical protein
MATEPSRKKKRGAARMKEFGYRQVAVWLDAAELVDVGRAAKLNGAKLATYIRLAAVECARSELAALLPNRS